jgi:hypothetical protein
MKKLFLIPIFTLSLSFINGQAEVHNSLGKYFKKNKVSKLNDYLEKDGGIRTQQKTVPNFLSNTPSLYYDVWELEKYEERYYVFRSYNDANKSKDQVNYIYNNLLDKTKTFYTIKEDNYYAYIQEVGGYEVLMVVLNH